MFCTSCGKEIADNAKFCPHCGNTVILRPQPVAPVQPTPKKGINPLLIILPIAAVVIIAVAVVLLCVFNAPTMKLSRAVSKSVGAYAQAAESLEVTDFAKLAEAQAYNSYLDLELTDVDTDYMGQIPTGIGLRYESAGSLPDRDLSVSLTPYYGSVDLLTAQLAFQGNYLHAYAPDILGEEYYAIDTTTLGADLAASGLIESDMASFGFNLFDLTELVRERTTPSAEAKKELADAAKKLTAAIEVEKGDTITLDVNGYSTKCTGYEVTIPQPALAEFLRVLERFADSVDYEALCQELFSAMGMPEEMIDEAMYNMELPSYSDAFKEIEDVLNEIGDLELDFYINSGYIHAIVWEEELYDEDVALMLRLGGGDTYVNDLSVEYTIGDNALLLTSHGNHSGAEDTYSDELVVEVTEYGETYTLLESEVYYYPEKKGTLEWSVTAEDVSLEMAGYLKMDKGSYSLSLEEVSLRQYGSKLLSFSLNYGISEYTPLLTVEEPTFLLPMTAEEQALFVADVEEHLMNWAMGLLTQIPELANMLY